MARRRRDAGGPSGDCEAPPEHREVYCPVAATIEVLQQKWTLLILRTLMGGKMRFNELAAAVGGCNSRTLRDRLRTLEEQGIVERTLVQVMPPWVEYELTPKGEDLGGVLECLIRWSQKWMARAPAVV